VRDWRLFGNIYDPFVIANDAMPVSARIKALREARGLSLRALAEAAGVSPAALSQIEQGQTSPSVATLEKLAHGLRVPVTEFFVERVAGEAVEWVDPDQCPTFALRDGAELVPLGPRAHTACFEPVLVRLAPGGGWGGSVNLSGVETEFAWVRSGRAVLTYAGEAHEVGGGQAVYYDPRREHAWHNPFDTPCELLLVRQR